MSTKPDLNQITASIVERATQEAEPPRKKDPAAVALGRRGGLKGGKARAEVLSKRRRSEIARNAAKTRWKKTAP